MSNGYLFLRKVELIAGQKVPFSNGPVEPVDGRLFRTRVKFELELDETSDANKAKIQVYNLSEDSKNFLEQENMVIFLNAGYGEEVSNLFFGDIQRVNEKREGADVITILECGDSEKIINSANITLGLEPGATNVQIIDEAVKKLNLGKGFQVNIPTITYQNGFSYSGSIKKLLDEMFKFVNLKWSVQGGEFQILETGKTDEQEAVVLSPNNGLIGSVTKTKDGIEFTNLLNAKLKPGRAVVIRSKRFGDSSEAKGKVTKAKFSGDSHEGKFEVKCEGELKE